MADFRSESRLLLQEFSSWLHVSRSEFYWFVKKLNIIYKNQTSINRFVVYNKSVSVKTSPSFPDIPFILKPKLVEGVEFCMRLAFLLQGDAAAGSL